MLWGLFEQEALFFTIPALLGTFVFVLKLGLMTLAGFGGDFDTDVDADVDVNLGEDAGDSTDAFTLLSLQSIAAFLMGFGWGGLAGHLGLDWSLPMSLLLGAGFGALLVWLLGLLMKAVYDLQSSGHVRVEDAVGSEGVVYANVPAKGVGRGQVRVVVNERARIYNAISDGEPIATSATIRVVQVNDDRSLTVTAV